MWRMMHYIHGNFPLGYFFLLSLFRLVIAHLVSSCKRSNIFPYGGAASSLERHVILFEKSINAYEVGNHQKAIENL